ncbi:PREDICTED: F-box/kelch-repeat protein At2g44700-like [Camelina sativa]|uniref:F-box/kelch-repeat protein At2g44700-like n=1 Tax=Camelina sativa TaxID=90675 RepID=A0ABM1RLC1_CAMSA|nr:PREDICTED: F-box/kelch-repeat protein At2g44700-like [Camelina sativa]
MSNLAASNADERPRKTNQPPSSSLSSPSLFSLPLDMVLNVLARVPKRFYPILCCVSNKMRSLVRSAEIHETRSLLGKDSLYIFFLDEISSPLYVYWYTLRRTENRTTENLFYPIEFSTPRDPCTTRMLAIDTEIFFMTPCTTRSLKLRILDTRSRVLRQGPSLLVDRLSTSVGLVGGKVYVIGGCSERELLVERFDLKTQTFEEAPTPDERDYRIWIYGVNVTLDRKVYALCPREGMASYDTRDGSCQRSEMPKDKWRRSGTCVIGNVLYLYFSRFGLMWYDTQLMIWRVVYGFDLDKAQCVGIAEYYGKLAILWEKPSPVSRESKEIWCTMIGLLRSDVGIHGAAEPSQLLGIVPYGYLMRCCLSVSA